MNPMSPDELLALLFSEGADPTLLFPDELDSDEPDPEFTEEELAGIEPGAKVTLTKGIPDSYVNLHAGLQGTVLSVSPLSIKVAWENGHELGLLPEDLGCFKIEGVPSH